MLCSAVFGCRHANSEESADKGEKSMRHQHARQQPQHLEDDEKDRDDQGEKHRENEEERSHCEVSAAVTIPSVP